MGSLNFLPFLPPVVTLALLVIAILILVVGWERYRPRPRLEFTMPTTEVHIDPSSGRRERVYVNPATGERAYIAEPITPGMLPPPLERPGVMGPPSIPPPGLSAGPPPAAPGPSG